MSSAVSGFSICSKPTQWKGSLSKPQALGTLRPRSAIFIVNEWKEPGCRMLRVGGFIRISCYYFISFFPFLLTSRISDLVSQPQKRATQGWRMRHVREGNVEQMASVDPAVAHEGGGQGREWVTVGAAGVTGDKWAACGY